MLELLHEQPMHPYEVARVMRQRNMDSRVKVKAGSLYHTMERLHGQELIEVVDTQRDGKRPERTVYAITASGRAAMEERAKEILGTVAEEYPEFPCGLGLLDKLPPEVALAELRHRALTLAAQVAADEVVDAELRRKQLPEEHWLALRYSLDRKNFELDWTRRLIEDIDSGRLRWRQGHSCEGETS